MQVYANSNRLSLNTILFFIIVLFIAFLPVSSFMFFLKNDAFNGYFPPKFFMSESLHAGHLPLWNPYINFGIPQYGDMSSGYWSPVTWLIASTVGYNAYTFTVELLLYILIGGLGMYKLSSLWVSEKHVRICAGVAYMCCGYNIGHLQHFNWLSGAAFLPWCVAVYLLLLKNFTVRNAMAAAILFYMLIASAHPGITICAFYFFLALACVHFFCNETSQPLQLRIKFIAKTHIIFFLFLSLLSAGMIFGYLDILPHFVRGEKISLDSSLSNPTNIQSWISAILPFATVKNDGFFQTDPSMRNSYFGLGMLLFFILACIKKKTGIQNFLLFTGIIFTLLASGGLFKTIAYKFIPFTGYVRLNGEFRIFALLCFILIAAIELDKCYRQKNTWEVKLRWIYYSLEIVLFGCIMIGLYKANHYKGSFIYNTGTIFSQPSVALKLKALLDAISFYDTLWMQGCLQMLFLWGIKYCLTNTNLKLLQQLTVINMIIASLFNIPFTGVGKSSVAEVQSVLNKAPKGIPVPALHPINENDSLSAEEKGLVGDWSLYNKQPGTTKEVPYPISLKNMNEYFEKNSWGTALNFLNHPFIFTEQFNEKPGIVINAFTGDKIDVTATTETATILILQQNFYPHWFYENGMEKKKTNPAGISFMSAPLVKGENHIRFSFEPVWVKRMMLLSLVALVLMLLLLPVLKIKQPSLS